MQCKFCKEDISDDATVCPYCQKQTNPSVKDYLIPAAFSIFACFLVFLPMAIILMI